MSETPTSSLLINTEFKLQDTVLAEIQNSLCSSYDEANKSGDLHSTDLWSASIAFVESGLNGKDEALKIHANQKEKLIQASMNEGLMKKAIDYIDSSIKTKSLRELINGLQYLFVSNLGGDSEANIFMRALGNKLDGVLMSQGY